MPMLLNKKVSLCTYYVRFIVMNLFAYYYEASITQYTINDNQ